MAALGPLMSGAEFGQRKQREKVGKTMRCIEIVSLHSVSFLSEALRYRTHFLLVRCVCVCMCVCVGVGVWMCVCVSALDELSPFHARTVRTSDTRRNKICANGRNSFLPVGFSKKIAGHCLRVSFLPDIFPNEQDSTIVTPQACNGKYRLWISAEFSAILTLFSHFLSFFPGNFTVE